MGAGVVAELGDVPHREGFFRDALLDCFEDRLLGFMERDVVVSDQAASRRHRFGWRRAVSRTGLSEVGKQGLDRRFCVSMQGDGVGLNPL